MSAMVTHLQAHETPEGLLTCHVFSNFDMYFALLVQKRAFCMLQFTKCESIVMVQHRFRTQYHNSFIKKTGLHLIFIMMSVDTSMIHFPNVGLDVLLKMTLLFFQGLQSHMI